MAKLKSPKWKNLCIYEEKKIGRIESWSCFFRSRSEENPGQWMYSRIITCTTLVIIQRKKKRHCSMAMFWVVSKFTLLRGPRWWLRDVERSQNEINGSFMYFNVLRGSRGNFNDCSSLTKATLFIIRFSDSFVLLNVHHRAQPWVSFDLFWNVQTHFVPLVSLAKKIEP